MTCKQKLEYLRNPICCPFCSGPVRIPPRLRTETKSIIRDLQCLKCGRLWTEHYRLMRVTEGPCG